ncbi:E3 ubiquitin-protein ligase MARCHF3-like [Lycorma delicatula]|uniref:E3 ubiquitin-protein ligase MARCHF3-like n=1 Tax=Lycorma delicatula TaxID=130591 RepID=UPI003F517654
MEENEISEPQLELKTTINNNGKDKLEGATEEESKENVNFCRICHDADSEEIFITPCRCKGTLSVVHRSCLEKWLAESDSSSCELCGQLYKTLRIPKYRYLPSIITWLRSEDSFRDVRELLLDLMVLSMSTPMVLIGSYLGLFAAENFFLYLTTELDPTGRYLTSARLGTLIVLSLMATIDIAFVSWLTVRTQYYIKQWHAWWRRQCTVKLLLPEDNRLTSQQSGKMYRFE